MRLERDALGGLLTLVDAGANAQPHITGSRAGVGHQIFGTDDFSVSLQSLS
jgi:hypothetical protein